MTEAALEAAPPADAPSVGQWITVPLERESDGIDVMRARDLRDLDRLPAGAGSSAAG